LIGGKKINFFNFDSGSCAGRTCSFKDVDYRCDIIGGIGLIKKHKNGRLNTTGKSGLNNRRIICLHGCRRELEVVAGTGQDGG